jgi:hypothetical protein
VSGIPEIKKNPKKKKERELYPYFKPYNAPEAWIQEKKNI